jgi:hypothetical protein
MKLSERKTIILIIIVSALAVFFIRFSYFSSYLGSPIVIGQDSTGHVELGRFYAHTIFPSTWGWASNWLAGIPFPQFYPPLFYILVAFFSKLLPLSYEMVFKCTLLLLTLSLPGLIALIVSRFTIRRSSWWIAALVAVMLVVTPFSTFDNIGISLSSTFSTGLVTQLLSFVCLLSWIYAWLGSFNSKRMYGASIIFLALTALSSVHLLPIALCIYCLTFTVQDYRFFTHPIKYFQSPWSRSRFFRYYLVPGILAIGLTSFWLFPFIATQSYMPSQSLGVTDGLGAANIWVIMKSWWPTALLFLPALYVALRKKNNQALIIISAAIATLLLVMLPVSRWLPTIPFHNYRIMPFIYFSGAFFAAYVFDTVATLYGRKIQVCVALGIFVLFLIPTISMYKSGPNFNSIYKTLVSERVYEIASYMKDKKGMYAVEAKGNARYLNSIIESEAGKDLRSNYTVFAESSLSSLFQTPFRTNITDKGRELLAVHSLLSNDKAFLNDKDPERLALRARALGISYLIMRSPFMKKSFATTTAFVLEKDFGAWTVYRVAGNPISDATVPPFKPALVVAPVGVKGTVSLVPTFMMLAERAFIKDMHEVTLARAPSLFIDDLKPKELGQFDTLIIGTYSFHSRQNALQVLTDYAKDHTLILYDSQESLVYLLHEALKNNPHVSFVDYDLYGTPQERYHELQAVSDEIVAQLAARQTATSKVSVTLARTNNSIDLKIASSSQPVPVLITSSFFPTWQRTDNAKVYLASPSYMLTFVTDTASIRFTTPWYIFVGYAGSILSLIILILGQGIVIKQKNRL